MGIEAQYDLSDADRACFECELDDCDEDSERCARKQKRSQEGHEYTPRKLVADEVRAIRRKHAQFGTLQKELAKEYGVSRSLIGRILRRDVWRDI